MANHDLVNLVISFLATNWNPDNYPGTYSGETPFLVDRDDATVYEITETGTSEVGDATVGVTLDGRRVSVDLTRRNAIAVDSSPTASKTPIGTEYDYDVEDGAHVRVEGVHESEFGHCEDVEEFEALYEEARRAVLVERVWPYRNPDGSHHYHTLLTANEANDSVAGADYYRWDADVLFRGIEELP